MTTEALPEDLQRRLDAADETIWLLKESLADVQRVMDRDQAGWAELGSLASGLEGFDASFRKRQAARILVASVANPLVKRGIDLRCAYVWGDGVQVSIDDTPDQGQDVNAVLQAFFDDPANQATWTDASAHIEDEKLLATVGEVWLCLPTDRIDGRVRVRRFPAEQITAILTDPEDEATECLYLREWTQPGKADIQRAWYPALGYRPAMRQQRVATADRTEVEVRWDAPLRPVRVNQVKDRGIGDAFAAVPWADSYKRFLEDWAQYMRSLTLYAWRMKTRGDRVSQASAEMARAAQRGDAGQGFAADPNTMLEAISKSGATIDADSGRPLAAMVAAALAIPVTTLLGDPGVTGARATAETVSEDSWAIFAIRREVWRSVIRDVCGWVIDAAIIAPAGPLRGTIVRDGDRQTAQLPEGDGRTVKVAWPEKDSTSVLDRVKAVQVVDQSEKLPPLSALRLYLQALGVSDADEILDMVTDEDGNFIPLDVLDAQLRQQMQDRGTL